jgi:transposase
MKITQQQYEKIADIFPRQRGNVAIDNLTMLNAMLHVLEHGCKWRGLPSNFGNWHSVYTRMSRWSKNGVLDRIFRRLQQEQMICLNADAFSLDSTVIKVHPDGTGALKKMARSLSANPAADGQQNCILLPPPQTAQ